MNTDLKQQELIERELTPDELEAISGGSEFTDFFKKIGDGLGEVGGVIIAGGYTVGQAFKGMYAEMTGDLTTARDIQEHTMNRTVEVFNDVKDGVGTKVLGGAASATIIGAVVKGSKMAFDVIRNIGARPTDIVNPLEVSSIAGTSPVGSPPTSRSSSFGVYDPFTSFQQLVGRSANEVFSSDQLQSLGVDANSGYKIQGYRDAGNCPDNLKEQIAAAGYTGDVKVGFFQLVSQNPNGEVISIDIPVIAANEAKKEDFTPPRPTGGFTGYGRRSDGQRRNSTQS